MSQAFPTPGAWTPTGECIDSGNLGMTLREWYAGLALQGVIAGYSPTTLKTFQETAEEAFKFADAMIDQSQKGA